MLRALEREKDTAKIVRVDTDAGVLDAETGDLVAVVDPHSDVSDIGELDGVRQKIDQNLV